MGRDIAKHLEVKRNFNGEGFTGKDEREQVSSLLSFPVNPSAHGEGVKNSLNL